MSDPNKRADDQSVLNAILNRRLDRRFDSMASAPTGRYEGGIGGLHRQMSERIPWMMMPVESPIEMRDYIRKIKNVDTNGGGGIYDEEQFMPIPPRLPPSAYRGGQSGMVQDYIMDRGAQSGANGWLNDRLLRRVQPEPMTDTEMMLMYGGDGNPMPVENRLLQYRNQR